MKKIARRISAFLVAGLLAAAMPVSASAAWKQNADKKWVYTEESGNATGWRNINNVWYHFNDSGIMETGWIKDGGTWYYLDANGGMKTGWVKTNNVWYYLDTSGAMMTDAITPDGLRVDANGAWVEFKPVSNSSVDQALYQKEFQAAQASLTDGQNAINALLTLIDGLQAGESYTWDTMEKSKFWVNEAIEKMLPWYDFSSKYTEALDFAAYYGYIIQAFQIYEKAVAPIKEGCSEQDHQTFFKLLNDVTATLDKAQVYADKLQATFNS